MVTPEMFELVVRAVAEAWPLPRLIAAIETLPEAQREDTVRALAKAIMSELHGRRRATSPPA